MKNLSRIFATGLATFIGIMSIIAGSQVVFGLSVPDYHVMNWLVYYNILFGFISLIVAYLIWKQHNNALAFSSGVIVSHASILVLLLSLFREVAADDSVKAMTFRMIIWTVILLLTYKSSKNEK